MKKLIEFCDISISLGERVLFKNLNFAIHEGERYMLQGKNGSGKSLLLELVFGGYTNELCRRYKGLKVSGRILDQNGDDLLNPDVYRKIAYVTQNEDFHNNATFLSEGITASRGIGLEFDEKQFDELLRRFDLFEKKKQKIKNNVSGGEGKLIHLITRILKLKATNVLLLDEPLNHLSFQNSRIFNDIINEIKEQNPNLTVLMISHCRAISFVDAVLQYNPEVGNFEKRNYHSYNCFHEDECIQC